MGVPRRISVWMPWSSLMSASTIAVGAAGFLSLGLLRISYVSRMGMLLPFGKMVCASAQNDAAMTAADYGRSSDGARGSSTVCVAPISRTKRSSCETTSSVPR